VLVAAAAVAAELDGAVPLQAVAAELDGAVPLQAVAAVAELDAAVPLPAGAAQVEAGEEAARRPAALGGVAARLAVVAWVFRLDRLLPWPGPGPAARSPREMQERSTASP
jgi:hypothetical protein